jgi:hypothetical protein
LVVVMMARVLNLEFPCERLDLRRCTTGPHCASGTRALANVDVNYGKSLISSGNNID